jgi:hypothetical protein
MSASAELFIKNSKGRRIDFSGLFLVYRDDLKLCSEMSYGGFAVSNEQPKSKGACCEVEADFSQVSSHGGRRKTSSPGEYESLQANPTE